MDFDDLDRLRELGLEPATGDGNRALSSPQEPEAGAQESLVPPALPGGVDSEAERQAVALQGEAKAAFYRDLPELLAQHPGKWVAYHGSQRLGVGHGKTTLLQACYGRGFRAQEVLVRRIQPGGGRTVAFFER
jgi:hypothetical protein